MLPPYQTIVQNRLAMASPAMSAGIPEDPMARARAIIEQMQASAPQGIDPRIAAILDRRLQRADEQERELQRAQKGTVWEALMRAGAAMASNQSPFFAPALAAGANAALNTVQQRRAEAARTRMGLADTRDAVEMERIQQEGAGQRAAQARLDRTIGLAKDISSMDADMARAQEALLRARQENDPQMRALKIAEAEAQIRAIRALERQRLADAANAGRQGGSPVEARADRAELDRAAARYRGAAARYEALRRANPGAKLEDLRSVDSKVVDDYLASRAELEGYSGAFERRYGSTPYIGGRNPSTGALVHQGAAGGNRGNVVTVPWKP